MDIARFPEAYRKDIQNAVAVLNSYGAKQIYVFGSLVKTPHATDARDIDIAVVGLAAERFFRAYGQLMMKLDHRFDLIDLSDESAFVRRLKESGALERVA